MNQVAFHIHTYTVRKYMSLCSAHVNCQSSNICLFVGIIIDGVC